MKSHYLLFLHVKFVCQKDNSNLAKFLGQWWFMELKLPNAFEKKLLLPKYPNKGKNLPGIFFPIFHRNRLFLGNLEQDRNFHLRTILLAFLAVFDRLCQAGFLIPIVGNLKIIKIHVSEYSES